MEPPTGAARFGRGWEVPSHHRPGYRLGRAPRPGSCPWSRVQVVHQAYDEAGR